MSFNSWVHLLLIGIFSGSSLGSLEWTRVTSGWAIRPLAITCNLNNKIVKKIINLNVNVRETDMFEIKL